MTAGINASSTSPVRGTRHPLNRRAASATCGWWATKPVVSSRSPSMDGTEASTQSAPSPHAAASTAEPSTLRLRLVEGSAVEAAAWGEGADWVLASVPSMLGDLDDTTVSYTHLRAHETDS